MYPSMMALLVTYGLCFGIQNKAVFLRGHFGWLDSLLGCSYCTGFHAGWVTWLLYWAADALPVQGPGPIGLSVATWAFGSAAFCYLVDVVATRLER